MPRRKLAFHSLNVSYLVPRLLAIPLDIEGRLASPLLPVSLALMSVHLNNQCQAHRTCEPPSATLQPENKKYTFSPCLRLTRIPPFFIYCSLFQSHNADAGSYESQHLHVVVTGSCCFDLVVRITRTVVSHAILQSAYRFQSLYIKISHSRLNVFAIPHAFFFPLMVTHSISFPRILDPPQYTIQSAIRRMCTTRRQNILGSWDLDPRSAMSCHY